MHKRHGFTIVEVLIIVVVIAIISTLVSFGFNRTQVDARDAQRQSSATTIAEALERYYEKNGEYPSCAAIEASASSLVASTLTDLDPAVLVAPQAPDGTTNSLDCSTLTINGTDFFEYAGDGTANCTGSVSCLEFTLRYKDQGNNVIRSISSRRS